jgi:hypothetical protein
VFAVVTPLGKVLAQFARGRDYQHDRTRITRTSAPVPDSCDLSPHERTP